MTREQIELLVLELIRQEVKLNIKTIATPVEAIICKKADRPKHNISSGLIKRL